MKTLFSNLKGYSIPVLLILLFFKANVVLAQQATIDIRVVALYSEAGEDDQAEHTWRISYKDDLMTNYIGPKCLQKGSSDSHRWFDISEFDLDYNQYNFSTQTYNSVPPSSITFKVDGWEDDAGRGCEKNNQDDNYHSAPDITINVASLTPGVYNEKELYTDDNYFGFRIQIRYTPIRPTQPTISDVSVCANGDITLTTSHLLYNTTGIQYVWEYNNGSTTTSNEYIDCVQACLNVYQNCMTTGTDEQCRPYALEECPNDCVNSYPPVLDWRVIGTSGSDTTYTFNLSAIYPGVLTQTTSLRFRVKAVSSDQPSPPSNASNAMLSVLPSPPTSTGAIIAEQSCTVVGTAKVTLNQISTPFSTYRYIIKAGSDTELDCNPQELNSDCLQGIADHGLKTVGTPLISKAIPPGNYSLFLLNTGGDYGICPAHAGLFTVHPITPLSITSFLPQSIDCHGANNGSVAVSIADGDPSNVSYTLSNLTLATGSTVYTNTQNATTGFDKLTPGNHRLTVSDGCTAPVIRTFDITQPTKVDLTEFGKQNASCTAPGNGSAKITIARRADPFSISSSTFFNYAIYRNGENGVLIDDETTSNEYLFDKNLAPGTYQLIAKEKGSADCNGYTETFTIDAPPAISLLELETTDVKCFNEDNGAITVVAQGGSGDYAYTLEMPGQPATTNTLGEFKNLKAGSYSLVTKNNFECDDLHRESIVISQPDQLFALAQKTDISCHGRTDGKLTSSVSGRTDNADYTFTWETNINASWVPIGITTASVNGRQDGIYRLRLTDANNTNCLAFSNEVEVIEPDPLEVSAVAVHDIICYGEKGKFEITSLGGTTPYLFHYSTNNGNSFSSFMNNQTLFDAGSYTIKITDVNGCEVTDDQSYAITAPSEPLAFSETLSDFNGYNISCYGGSNGSATLVPVGGNAASYVGYTYALDGIFQTEPLLSQINAGPHLLGVRDDRGCVVSKTLTFTQTTGKLTPQLISKKDVACFGDTNGSLDVNATGGLGPFKFSINGLGNQQDHGQFAGLKVGDYTVSIIDKNNCDNNFTYTITSINPKIQIGATVNDVNCFEGSDGSIQAFIIGGTLPLQYKWNNTLTTSSVVNGLRSGTHTLQVIDNAGCKMDSSIVVLQPANALAIKTITIPVCYGRTDGSITVTGLGGTSPYHYSIDNGQHYQANSLFTKVALGKYSVKAQDKNGCTISQDTEVILRTDRPEPNFLVATKRNALDTLIVTEVSVPKPDSVIWNFDANARLLNENQWSPQLKFESAGTYVVSMTGFFGGCDYAITKNIFVSPFDPTAQPEKLPGFKPIEKFEVSPNPSSGEFEVVINLNKKYNVSLIVYDMIGSVHFAHQWENTQGITQNVQLKNVAAGVYLVRAITENDAKDIRIIIK